MRHWLFIFSVFSCSLLAMNEEPQIALSTPDQIATLFADNESLVGGYVSPLSGQVVIRETDLVAKGAQDIVLSRIYIPLPLSPPSNIPPPENGSQTERYKWFSRHKSFWTSLIKDYQGWTYLPHLFMELDDFRGSTLLLRDKNGSTYEFRNSGNGYTFASAIYGVSNLSDETPSGVNDPRNFRIEAKGQELHVFCPDGSTRIYQKANITKYKLDKEILPNGKVIRYTYQTPESLLIESLDSQERYVYSSLQVQKQPTFKSCKFLSHRGDQASYTYENQIKDLRFKQKKKDGKLNKDLPEESSFSLPLPPTLAISSSPAYRSTSIGYTPFLQVNAFSGKNGAFRCGYDDLSRRIKSLSFPVGKDHAFVNLYEMSYDPPIPGHKGGSTTVRQIDGVKLVYHFSPSLLTTSIQTFDPEGQLKKEKIFTWRSDNRIESIEVKDGNGALFYRKTFSEYDSWGNPWIETLIGDLSGDGNLESRMTKRVYSKDGKNLLLREETEEGKATLFEYRPGTNLVESKLVFDHDKIILREFQSYDDCNNLIEQIVDDSASRDKATYLDATQRTITRYKLCQDPQFLHMPEWIEEYYWDGSTEQLLKKTKLTYDERGNVKRKELHGSDGKLAKTFSYEYDEQGNLLSETNHFGQKATHEYTSKGECKYSKNFSGRLETTRDYDAQGRLKKLENRGAECGTHRTTYEYDPFDRCLRKVDYLGNCTDYQPDPISGKIKEIQGPSILSLQGKTHIAQSSNYDALGRLLEIENANNFVTLTRYNTYGSPVEIIHPNGSKETYRYYKNGLLKSHTNQDGLTIEYTYDLFDRILEKKFFSEKTFVAQESFTYSSFQLLTHTDKEKNTTIYSYDQAGRKISATASDRVATYQYDSLGRLSTITKNQIVSHFDWDPLDRIKEERQTDLEGRTLSKIKYGYDADGNKSSITRFPHNQEQSETFEYDPFGRIILQKDALGHATVTQYDETNLDSLGYRVLTTVSTDPNGVETTIAYDPYERETSRQIGSSYLEERTYDPNGNLLQIKEGSLLTHYIYNNQDLLESATRAYGTNEARTTSYTYTPGGLVWTKTNPDEAVFMYEYDPLGSLKSLICLNGTINQRFIHNLNGHLTYAYDGKHTIERIVDRFGNICQETIDQKFVLAKTYNDLDLPLTITLPDASKIEYGYNPLYLNTVKRYSPDGSLLYIHTYDSYDWAGHPLEERLINNLGRIQHTFNPNGQKKAMQCLYFSQALEYDAKGRVSAISGEGSYDYDELSQVTLDRSSLIYEYDRHYNRIQKNGVAAEYNGLDELLSPQMVYDLNGNLSQKGDFTFTYDALNRLIRADSPDVHLAFTYDPLNRRITKTSSTTTEVYLYDGTEELGSFETNGTAKDLKIPGLCQKPIALELQGQLYAPILDYRGNIRRLVDIKSAKTIQHLDYTAFGEELTAIAPHFNPWCYCAKRYDQEIGLYYFGHRFYDPALGRWSTIDPAGFIDGTNLYAYVLNNPLSYMDPDGRSIDGRNYFRKRSYSHRRSH